MESTQEYNEKVGGKIAKLRKRKNWTQAKLAEQLAVSSQAVSSWERGDSLPDVPKVLELAKTFEVTTDYILCNKKSGKYEFTDEKKMFTYIKGYTNSKQMYESQKALQYAREMHKNQRRKEGKPYIIHPLTMTCDALAMGIDQDEIVAAILLHDVCEDCDVKISDLPVNDSVKNCVKLLTFNKYENESLDEAKKRYYDAILKNENATIVKLLDRCHNVSNMCKAFSQEQMIQYIEETRKYILPLQKKAKKRYPHWNNVLFVLKYHIISVIDSVECVMDRYKN